MNLPAVGQSDRKVLLALQGLVLGLPLFLGGRQPWALAAASAAVLVLLAVTIRERRRRGTAPYPPGIKALVLLVGLLWEIGKRRSLLTTSRWPFCG